MMITFSGEPVAISELLSPLASANRATNTATTSAIVPMVISVLTRLTIRLRRLYLRGIAIMPSVPGSGFRVQGSEFQLSRLGMLVVRKGGLPPLPGLGPETAGVN